MASRHENESVPSVLEGFDKFYGFYLGASDYWKHYSDVDDNGEPGLDLHQGGIGLNREPGDDQAVYSSASQYSTTLYANKAIEWIGDHARERPQVPWYMYLAFQGTHSSNNKFLQAPVHKIEEFDYISPNETCGQYDVCSTTPTCTKRAMRKTCAATLAVVDDAIRDIVEQLKSVDMYENTIIIYSSDNGGPADGVDNNMMNNYPLRSGKGSTWEGGIRAAGFIHAPYILKRTGVSNDLFHVSDWYKSLFKAAAGGGVAKRISLKPTEVPWKQGDGIDNWDMLASSEAEKVPSARTEIIIAAQASGSIHKTNAIRVKEMKLLWAPNLLYDSKLWYYPPGSDKYNYTVKCGKPPANISGNSCENADNPCLYNISADPCEHHNLALKMPELVAKLKAKIAEYSKTTIFPWKQYSQSDERALPSNHGGKVKIVPNKFKGGPSEYNGIWTPWLNTKESAGYYPENYTGPGY